MTQQTAVEWYVVEFADKLRKFYGDGIIDLDLLNKAKEMEKKQIEKAFDMGMANGFDYGRYDDEPKYPNAEQYYNETYGGDK